MGAGKATLTVSLKWNDVPIAPTTHELRVLEPSGVKTLPVSARLVRSLPHPDRTASLWSVRFGDGGRLFASGYPSGVVQIWDPLTGKELRRVESPRGYRGSADYALTTDALKALYVPIEGRKVTRLDDPKKRARLDYNGHLLVYDLATGKEKAPIPAAKGRGVVTAQLSPDGSRLLTIERAGFSGGEERPSDIVRLIDTATGKAREIGEGYAMAAFSKDSGRLYLTLTKYTGEQSSKLVILDAEGKELKTLAQTKGEGYGGPILSPDGKHLAVRGGKGRINQPGEVVLFDLATGEKVAELPTGGDYPFMLPAFSPDGRLLACGDYGGNLHLWDVPGRKLLRKQRFEGKAMSLHVAFSNDGTRLAVPVRVKSDLDNDRDPDPLDVPQPRVYLFDLVKGGEPEEVVCPHGWAGGVAFSADGKLLAVGGAGAVHLFDVARK